MPVFDSQPTDSQSGVTIGYTKEPIVISPRSTNLIQKHETIFDTC